MTKDGLRPSWYHWIQRPTTARIGLHSLAVTICRPRKAWAGRLLDGHPILATTKDLWLYMATGCMFNQYFPLYIYIYACHFICTYNNLYCVCTHHLLNIWCMVFQKILVHAARRLCNDDCIHVENHTSRKLPCARLMQLTGAKLENKPTHQFISKNLKLPSALVFRYIFCAWNWNPPEFH